MPLTSQASQVSAANNGAAEHVEYTPPTPLFHKALREWMEREGVTNIQQLLVDPRGPGLSGRINFSRERMGNFVTFQYKVFWNLFSQHVAEAGQSLVHNRHEFAYIFEEAAFYSLSALLMTGIMNGKIPHPEGRRPGTDGALEAECWRSIGGDRKELGIALTEKLKKFSSGNPEHDVMFIKAMSFYLGLDQQDADHLEARTLDRHKIPNIYRASELGCALQTSMLQLKAHTATPEFARNVILRQTKIEQWHAAYKQNPLLDMVLAPALEHFDPARQETFYRNYAQQMRDDFVPSYKGETFDEFKLEMAQVDEASIARHVLVAHVIVNALRAFRVECLGTKTIHTALEDTARRTALCVDDDVIDV